MYKYKLYFIIFTLCKMKLCIQKPHDVFSYKCLWTVSNQTGILYERYFIYNYIKMLSVNNTWFLVWSLK